jgi:hypothetical protein
MKDDTIISDRVILRHRHAERDLDTWSRKLLTDVVVDGEVVSIGFALPEKAQARAEEIAQSLITLRLMSSIGVLSVDAKTGKVVGQQYDSTEDEGTWSDVVSVDVDDYYRRYPTDLQPGKSYEIDILYFGVRHTTGGVETIDPPVW